MTKHGDLLGRYPVLLLAGSAAFGIASDAVVTYISGSPQPAFGCCLLVIATLGFAIGTRMRSAAVIVVFGCIASIWHSAWNLKAVDADILRIIDTAAEPVVVEGSVLKPIVLQPHPLAETGAWRGQSRWQSQFPIAIESIRIGRQLSSCTGNVLVFVDGDLSRLRPGDVVQAMGEVQAIGQPSNPGQRDLRQSYQRRGLHARIHVSDPSSVKVIDWHPVFNRKVADLATRSRQTLQSHTSRSNGPLAVALVLGQREFVESKVRDELLVTGTAHLLSVSGLHLAIVVVLASWLATLTQMTMPIRIFWIVAVCGLYTAITGGRPPVLRAAVLVSVLMAAIWLRRPSQPINTLSCAAILLMLLNPTNVFNVGVQLSFLAVATLFLCGNRLSSRRIDEVVQREEQFNQLVAGVSPPLVRYFRWIFGKLLLALWFSLCVTMLSAPLVWHRFHVISPISVLTNVLLGPFLFFSLAMGIATVIGGMISTALGKFFGSCCDVGLTAMQTIIHNAAGVPYGHFWLPSPPDWWILAFYIVMAASLCLPKTQFSSMIRYGWIVVWMICAWWMATTVTPLPNRTVEATFIDVGHGTSVVLRGPNERVWLYDCGRLANRDGESRDINSTLWSMGITHLDGIFLSHADSDHYNALPGVLRRFSVKQIFTTPGMLDEPEIGLKFIRAAIEQASVPVSEVWRDQPIQGESNFRIAHPTRARIQGSDNANSLVLTIAHEGRVLILPGDLESPGTEMFLDQVRPKPGGALMAPHHGSLTMDASAVLHWARPNEVVVSGGPRAQRVEVRDMLGTVGNDVHITSEVGAIRVRLGKDGTMEVRSWIQSPW